MAIYKILTFVYQSKNIPSTKNKESKRRLRHILESERLTYSEELALLMKQHIAEAARRRHEWFGICRKERQLEIEKFLELKNLQREMESCEETRSLQSKALLLDTKQAQLYQIKEKESIRQKEKQVEQMWIDVSRRFEEEMVEQDNLERKLLNIIARRNQERNLKDNDCQKQRTKTIDKASRDDFSKDNVRAALVDRLYLTRMKTVEKNKKLHQQTMLEEQINKNEENRRVNQQQEFNNVLEINKQNLCDILNNHYREEKQKIHDAVWQEHYIYHVKQEKQRKDKESKEIDAAFLGTGCVLQQRNKIPYSKTTR